VRDGAKSKRIDACERRCQVLDFLPALSDQHSPFFGRRLVEHSKKRAAVAEQCGMFSQQSQLSLAIKFGAPNQVRNRKGKMLVDGARFQDVTHAISLAAQSQPEVQVFRYAEARIKRTRV
jgi:hypothetical protein